MTDAGGQSRSPTSSEVLRLAINSILSETHTMLPGRVDEYDPALQSVTVTPVIQRLTLLQDGGDLAEDLPPIPNVPVVFPRTQKAFLTLPIAKGDLVMLLFAERSLDNWLASAKGEVTNPDEFRQHDLTDAVAYPGLYPYKLALKDISAQNLVIGFDEGGMQIHITPDGTMEVKVNGVSDEVAVLGKALEAWWNTTLKPNFDTHGHPTGVGPSGPPLVPFPVFPAAALSNILKLVSG